MRISYHSGDLPEAVIVASPTEYSAMAGKIANLAFVARGDVVFSAGSDGRHLSLVVSIGQGPAQVTIRTDGNLSVTGDPKSIELFGLNMPIEMSLPDGYHVHFEHVGREWFVAPESIPMVMEVGNKG